MRLLYVGALLSLVSTIEASIKDPSGKNPANAKGELSRPVNRQITPQNSGLSHDDIRREARSVWNDNWRQRFCMDCIELCSNPTMELLPSQQFFWRNLWWVPKVIIAVEKMPYHIPSQCPSLCTEGYREWADLYLRHEWRVWVPKKIHGMSAEFQRIYAEEFQKLESSRMQESCDERDRWKGPKTPLWPRGWDMEEAVQDEKDRRAKENLGAAWKEPKHLGMQSSKDDSPRLPPGKGSRDGGGDNNNNGKGSGGSGNLQSLLNELNRRIPTEEMVNKAQTQIATLSGLLERKAKGATRWSSCLPQCIAREDSGACEGKINALIACTSNQPHACGYPSGLPRNGDLANLAQQVVGQACNLVQSVDSQYGPVAAATVVVFLLLVSLVVVVAGAPAAV